MRIPTCHPERKHQAFGLCMHCYQKQRIYTSEQLQQRNSTNAAKARKLKYYIKKKSKNPTFTVDAHRLKRYGLSPESYLELLTEQHNKCKICLVDFSTTRCCIDHDHDTGVVRGLLCQKCNTSIGMFRDSEFNILRALAYLKSTNTLKGKLSDQEIQGPIRFVDM